MGYGDELMAAGRAQRFSEFFGGRVGIYDRFGNRRWCELWRDNPHIAPPNIPDDIDIRDGAECRPYIDYERTTKQRWVYKPYKPIPAKLLWVKSKTEYAGRLLIEPNIKVRASPNKQWGWENWQALARLGKFSQIGYEGAQWLEGVERIYANSFEEAVNVISGCRGTVLPEGGLHHACAAVRVPAVVLFGPMLSPDQTGYEDHCNIAINCPETLGLRTESKLCRDLWKTITPAFVMESLLNLLGE